MPKYSIENGIYKKDGAPIFALGVSYYPSYHERKVPVPPEEDREKQAELDIGDMADFGFNIVRCAALGDVYYTEDKKVTTKTPLLDCIAKKCDTHGIGLMLRLQGYTMNMSGYTDTLMINHRGQPMDKSLWYDFNRDCLFHRGLKEDNDKGTAALAVHFAAFPSVVGFQTYNEPHYPSGGIYDYHPKTVEAYRRWLTEKGYMRAEEVKNYEPPRKRPSPNEDATEWIRWRTFSTEAMTDFLCHSSSVAKGVTGLETMTCITSGPTHTFLPLRGEDFFGISEGMDALGITQYYLVRKPEAYAAVRNLSLAESSAALARKPLWIVEYDAKTDASSEFFVKNTLIALGTGIKGLLYYQWRGDHVYPDSPEGNGFGIINYDRTKTKKYTAAKRVAEYVNSHSELLMGAKKHRSGVAILRSFYGIAHADAKENYLRDDKGIHELRNSWIEEEAVFFSEMAKNYVIPDFIRAEDLEENRLDVRVLFIPRPDLISKEEGEAVKRFSAKGGQVVSPNESDTCFIRHAYKTSEYTRTKFSGYLDAADVCKALDITPQISFAKEENTLLLQTLDTEEGMAAVITNIENLPGESPDPTLKVPKWVTQAIAEELTGKTKTLTVKAGKIRIGKIKDGCIVRLIGQKA